MLARVLRGLAVLAAVLLLGTGSAFAASASKVVSVTCSGDTLTGVLQLTGLAPGTTVTVAVETQTSGWSTTPTSKVITSVAGVTSYPFTLDVSPYRTAKAYRVTATGGPGNSASSSPVQRAACAPPPQVPEVPAPLAIPVSLGLTAAVLELGRRTRRRPQVAGG